MNGYFMAPDANGDMWIWRKNDRTPVPVISLRDLDPYPDLRAAFVAFVEGAS